MVSILKKEKGKIIFSVLLFFIVQVILILSLYNFVIKGINERYINQNIEIIGEVAKKDSDLAKKIAPIITGKESGDFSYGEEFIKSFSYNKELNPSLNPLIGKVSSKFSFGILIILALISFLIIAVIMGILSPLFKKINYLTLRAEDIVEGKFREDDYEGGYNGSLEKFIFKFSQMEGRINNSIHLLQKEKINLKNIINDISHQLKTPLTALSMYNDILSDHSNMENGEVDDFIDLSNEQLERMDWLVKTLLKYARLESNVVEYHKEVVTLNNTILESINPLKVKASEKRQSLTFSGDEEILFLHDRKWIAEALSNIVKNAIEHTDDGGKILVFLEETPLSIVIGVKDNGEGIEKEEQRKIFNRFHKGQNSINPKSIGIGLCLSKSIVMAHGGDISVESEIGKGSTFYITFLKNIY